jgi:hypothetical protein
MPVGFNRPDWDTDRRGEDQQIFLNPGEPGFQTHLYEAISATVREFGVPGAFLDTSACWVDDPRFDLFRGYEQLVGRIREDFPDLLLCGEGWYDAMLALFPMFQTWVPVKEVRLNALPDRYGRILGHLKSGAPGTGSTGVHEQGKAPILSQPWRSSFIPAISVVDDTLTRWREELRDWLELNVPQS